MLCTNSATLDIGVSNNVIYWINDIAFSLKLCLHWTCFYVCSTYKFYYLQQMFGLISNLVCVYDVRHVSAGFIVKAIRVFSHIL